MKAPRKKTATLQSIADQLGLSRATVSEILGGQERYAEATRKRVFELANELQYQPNRSAQAIRRGRSNLIGVLHTSGNLQVLNERAIHLGHSLAKTGYDLLLADWLWQTHDNILSLVRHMLASRIEGFIFSGSGGQDDPTTRTIFQTLQEAEIPSVFISSPSLPDVPAVNADFEGGFYALTRHLLSTGRRRLTLLLASAPEAQWHGALRHRGFCRAIEEAGGRVREPALFGQYSPQWRSGIEGEVIFCDQPIAKGYNDIFTRPRTIMSHLLDHGFETDGLLATNDEWAAAAIAICIARGVAIPEAFAVTGFDNSYLSTLGPVPITSASQESEATCQLAVDLLLARMKGERPEARNYLIPTPLIERASTAAVTPV